MGKREINTDRAPLAAGAYSQGIQVGNRIYVSGQGPFDPRTGAMPTTVEEQTRQVLRNVQAILEAAGGSLADVVKVTAHLADMRNFARYDQVYREVFQPPYPVRTTVGSQLYGGMLVEIDVIAELPE